MKLTFIMSILSVGGAERVLMMLADKMLDAGHDVSIICVEGTETVGREYHINPKVNIITLGSTFGVKEAIPRIIIKSTQLYNVMRKLKSDVYISFITHINVYSLIAGIFSKSKIIICERGAPECDATTKESIFLRDKLYKYATGLVCQTEAQKDFLKNICHISERKFVIIPNPVKPNIQPPFLGERRCDISAIGRFCEHKNFPVLLHAFAKVLEKHPHYTLSIYGRGETQIALIRLAKELGIADKVIFKGFRRDVHNAIIDSKMFVLSSYSEGMPNALIEAMALGMPVVSTDCYGGGPRFLIDNNVNGLLVPNSDFQALADAMTKIIDDDHLSATISKNAVEIKNRLNIDLIVQKWLDYVQQIN